MMIRNVQRLWLQWHTLIEVQSSSSWAVEWVPGRALCLRTSSKSKNTSVFNDFYLQSYVKKNDLLNYYELRIIDSIMNRPFWAGASGNAVIIEADAFKESDVIYRALSSRGHADMIQTAELVRSCVPYT